MKIKSENKGIIVPFWNFIFKFLEKLSIFTFIRYISLKLFKKKLGYRFVELWVLFNLVLSISVSIIVYLGDNNLFMYFLIGYGLFRTFEIIIYQINVILFHPYRSRLIGKEYKIKSPTRIVILLFHNYFEIIFWYSSVYIVLSKYIGIESSYRWYEYIKMSLLCFATFDPSLAEFSGVSYIVSNIAFTELFAGFIMTIISLARFIGLLPEVESIEKI